MKKRIIATLCIIVMLLTLLPAPVAFAASTKKMTTVDEIVKTADKVLGAKYSNEYACEVPAWPGKVSSVDWPGTVHSVKEVKRTGIDCTGLVWWTTVQLGFWANGFHNEGSRRYYPFSTYNWEEAIDNTDSDPAVNRLTRNGKTYSLSVPKIWQPETKYSWWELPNGETISPGSIVIAKRRHGAFYIGEFFSKADVVDYLVKMGADRKVAEANVVDEGTGGTHWIIESTARWNTWRVVVTNPTAFISSKNTPVSIVCITPDSKTSNEIKHIRVVSGARNNKLDGAKLQVYFGNKAHPVEYGKDNILLEEKDGNYYYSFKYNDKLYPITTNSSKIEKVQYNINQNKIFESENTLRLSGDTRYETSLSTADALKTTLGINKFENIIIANGEAYADALAGGVLADKLNAPIIIVNSRDQNSFEKKVPDKIFDYISDNLKKGGKVYILGGTMAVSWNFQDEIGSRIGKFNVVRVGGDTRYDTNLQILKLAGNSSKTLLVTDAYNYADALSCSSLDYPILLIDKNTGKLTSNQKKYLKKNNFEDIYIIGGKDAVPKSIGEEIKDATGVKTKRLAGDDRYETSKLVANQFFKAADASIITYGGNFPDALCGGILANTLDAPVLLVNDENYKSAKSYISKKKIEKIVVLGGKSAVSNNLLRNIEG